MMAWKMIFLFQGCILSLHVNLPGCTSLTFFHWFNITSSTWNLWGFHIPSANTPPAGSGAPPPSASPLTRPRPPKCERGMVASNPVGSWGFGIPLCRKLIWRKLIYIYIHINYLYIWYIVSSIIFHANENRHGMKGEDMIFNEINMWAYIYI